MKPEPKRILLRSLEELPSLDAIVKIAQGNEWVTFEFPAVVHVLPDKSRTDETEAKRQALCDALAPLLPTHQIWDNFIFAEASLPAARQNQTGSVLHGTATIRLRRLVSREEIAPYLPQLETAAREYRRLANFLAPKLAEALGVELSMFATNRRWQSYTKQQHGILETAIGRWSYGFHGFDCRFTDEATNKELHVPLGKGPDFGILDAWFFLNFIESTEAYKEIAEVIKGEFYNMNIVLSILEEQGILPFDQTTMRWCLAAPDKEPIF